MKTTIALVALVLSVTTAHAQAVDRAKLLGSWQNAGKGFTQRQTFHEDGRFETAIQSDNAMMNRQESGKWTLDGAVLKLKLDHSTTDGRAGKSASLRIRRLGDEELVLQKGPANPDETVTFTRVK